MTLKIYHAAAADALPVDDRDALTRHCRETETIDLSKPFFFCAGGIETNSLKRSCGYLNVLCELLGREIVPDKDFNFYTLVYAEDVPEKQGMILDEYKGEFKRSRTAKRETNNYALKLVQAMDGQLPDVHGLTGDEREEQLGLLAARLRNINFFCFSLGSMLTTSFHEALLIHLIDKKGVTEEEAKTLMPNVKVLTLGEMGLWQHKPYERWLFTSVHTASSTDDLIQWVSAMGSQPETQLLPFGKHSDIRKANELLLLVQLDLRHPDIGVDKTGHMLKTYVAEGFPRASDNMLTRKAAQTVLRNYLACSQGTRFEGTLDMMRREPWDDLNMADIAHAEYQRRLDNAILPSKEAQGTWATFINTAAKQGTARLLYE